MYHIARAAHLTLDPEVTKWFERKSSQSFLNAVGSIEKNENTFHKETPCSHVTIYETWNMILMIQSKAEKQDKLSQKN